MVNQQQLLEMLIDLESDRIERTVSTGDTDKFSQAVCAFANDFPNHRKAGYLFIGARDDGTPSGLTVSDKLLQNLAALRSGGNIQPLPAIHVEKFAMEGGEVAVVEVLPSDLPPVRYKGRIWIRIGPSKAIASEQEERILSERRASLTLTFDATPCGEAKTDDIALRLFDEYRLQAIAPEVIAANHRTLEQKLAALRFFDLNKQCLTYGGILLFGTNPRYFLPGAYVQFVKFPHASMTELPLDQEEISGDLRTVLSSLEEKFRAHNKTALEQGENFKDKYLPDYPEWAIRELLHNAVLHRDYRSTTPIRFYWFSDRIEIISPGGLYGGVTPQTLGQRNSYRNPIIAEAMKEMGYVNRFGYGIQRAQELLKENGNPPADFSQTDENFFVVTIYRRNA